MTDVLGLGGLQGLRVVEMGVLLAGPFCGQLLADHGAEVIKIEQPGVGDPMREWGREKPHGKSLWWPVVARNKKSVTLNLRTEAGQALARQLIDDFEGQRHARFPAGVVPPYGVGRARPEFDRQAPQGAVRRLKGQAIWQRSGHGPRREEARSGDGR